MCAPRIETISPLRIAFRANRPPPWVPLRRTMVFGDRYEAAIMAPTWMTVPGGGRNFLGRAAAGPSDLASTPARGSGFRILPRAAKKPPKCGSFFAVGPGWWLNRHMDHQTDAPEGLGPSPVPPKLVLSNEVRASLQAVRVAQDAARVGARQQTLTTRVWFAASLAMLAAVGFTLAPRVARWRHGGVHAAPAAHPATTASE